MHGILSQGGRERPDTRPGFGREGHDRALEVAERMMNRMREWMREAEEDGSEEAVKHMRKGLHEAEKLFVALKEARGPERMAEIRNAVEEHIRDLREELGRAKRDGKPEMAEKGAWIMEHLGEILKILERAGGRGPGFGREGMDDRMRERMKQAESRIREMVEKAEALEREGHEEEARALRERAEAMKRALQARLQRPGGERGDRGRGGEREEFGREIRRLSMEMRRAQQEGDEERVEQIRRRIAEMREQMRGRGREEGRRDREPEEEGEVKRLRREIEDMKKELKELKKLLKKLLREGDED
jgi:hypothetical protein